MGIAVRAVGADLFDEILPELVALLKDAVESGASIGFMPPLLDGEETAYWRDVGACLADGSRLMLIAVDAEKVVGTVQLALEDRPNGNHRAEVSKLMVHSRSRRAGIGRMLMEAMERAAVDVRRTTLVLDTRQGDTAERLYRRLGYKVAGQIPDYARSADGSLHTTTIMYKLDRKSVV
jgi:acetyltransferase